MRMPAETQNSDPQPENATIAAAAERLFAFAIDRDDLKGLVAHLPADDPARPVALTYELQLLKIVCVGWSIAYFGARQPYGEALTTTFWNKIKSFSSDISNTSSAALGEPIDYFDLVKERLDTYVRALQHFADAPDPAAVIGATLAKLCGDEANAYLIISGKRTFNHSSGSVRNYLHALPHNARGATGSEASP